VASRITGGSTVGAQLVRYLVGDIRHCFSDIQSAHDLLGYKPQIKLEHSLHELIEWLRQQFSIDRIQQAHAESEQRVV